MLVRSLMIASVLVLGSTRTAAQDECAGLRKITEVQERVGAALDSLKGKPTGGGNPKEGRLEFESKFRLPDFNCVIESIAASQGKRAQRAVVCTRKLSSQAEADALHDAFPYAKCLSTNYVCAKKKGYGSTLATACARMQPTILVFWSTRFELDPSVRLSIRYVGD